MSADKDGYIGEVAIEVTRRCNFSCSFCLRGDAQNVDLDPRKLGALLSEHNIKIIGRLIFTGGEPFLKPKIISDVIEELIHRDIEYQYYEITTNGSMFTKDALAAIGKLHNYASCNDDIGNSILVSQSDFHKEDKNYDSTPLFYDNFADYALNEIINLDENDYETEDEYYYEQDRALNEIPYSHNLHKVEIQKREEIKKSSARILNTGRYGTGSDNIQDLQNQSEEDKKFIYINANCEILEDYCDMSYKLQRDIQKEPERGHHE